MSNFAVPVTDKDNLVNVVGTSTYQSSACAINVKKAVPIMFVTETLALFLLAYCIHNVN